MPGSDRRVSRQALDGICMMTIRHAGPSDAPTIADIYNEGIVDRSATFETQPRTADDILGRLADSERFPMLVAVEEGVGRGWAALSVYRSRPCYAGIAEFSIYLDRAARGRGVGRQLLDALIDAARHRGYWKLCPASFPSIPRVAPCADRVASARSASTRSTVVSTACGSTSWSSNA